MERRERLREREKEKSWEPGLQGGRDGVIGRKSSWKEAPLNRMATNQPCEPRYARRSTTLSRSIVHGRWRVLPAYTRPGGGLRHRRAEEPGCDRVAHDGAAADGVPGLAGRAPGRVMGGPQDISV